MYCSTYPQPGAWTPFLRSIANPNHQIICLLGRQLYNEMMMMILDQRIEVQIINSE